MTAVLKSWSNGVESSFKNLINVGIESLQVIQIEERRLWEPSFFSLLELSNLRSNSEYIVNRRADSHPESDKCTECNYLVEGECFLMNDGRTHKTCFQYCVCGKNRIEKSLIYSSQRLCGRCAKYIEDFSIVSAAQQYVFLLHVARARVIAQLVSAAELPAQHVVSPGTEIYRPEGTEAGGMRRRNAFNH
jgi:hypothetical protein